MPKSSKYDLEERTAKFGEAIIDFAKKVPKGVITNRLVDQFIGSGTAIGAAYCEADCAESRRDFEHKMGIGKKEAKETKHWMRMIARACPELKDEARVLWKEASELQRIFIAIIIKSKKNAKDRLQG